VRVAGPRVQEEISQMMARHVSLERFSFRKDQATVMDSTQFSFPAEIDFGRLVVFEQPKHTPVDLIQNFHPYVKSAGQNLVVVIETTKNKTIVREAEIRPFEIYLRNWPL
jgi:hypothetical protein